MTVKDGLIAIFESGIKSTYLIGAEFEHFVVNRNTLLSYNYYEPQGIRAILEAMLRVGWTTNDQQDKLMTLKKGDGIITLEPGGQIELSVMPQKDTQAIDQIYKSFVKDMQACLSPDQALVSLGYHPKSQIKDIPFIPKDRYGAMSAYFETKGDLAHNMMKGTASTQVGIDYTSEADFADKYLMFSALSPFITAYFDTTPIFEGKALGGRAMRMQIWDRTDKDRSGLLKEAFELTFDFSAYAERVMQCPPILMVQDQGVIETHGQTVADLEKVMTLSPKQIDHVLTMMFPDVRLKNFVEVRMADAMPYPLNMGYVELIHGLTYCDSLLKDYVAWAKTCSYQEIENLKTAIVNEGVKAEFRGQSIQSFMQDLLNKVVDACQLTSHLEKLMAVYSHHPEGYANYLSGLSGAALLKEVEVNIHA